MITSSIDIRVRYAETDQMGVVYHANYLAWFEQSRVQMLDDLGMPYRELESRDFMLPVVSCQLAYKQPARFDDRLKVHCFVESLPKLKLAITYRVEREDTLLTTGETVHVFMGRDGSLKRPPQEFLETFKKHF